MGRSVHVLIAGTFLAMVASGIAYADKPLPQPVPVPHGPLTGNVVVKTQSTVLKTVKPLTSLQKVGVIKTAISAAPTEQNFDTPIRMNARTPYIDTYTYLAVYDAGFNPFFDPPEFLVRSGNAQAEIHFRAQPDRTYLVDCSLDPHHVAQFQTYVDAFVPGIAVSVDGQSAMVGPPPDLHMTFVVRKDTRVRDIEIRIIGGVGNSADWRLGTCEITPVRGL